MARPFIIPVFIPQAGCPHRCAFCNQNAVTGISAKPSIETIRKEIIRYLGYKRECRGKTEISFYGGNFLGQNPETIKVMLELAGEFVKAGLVNGIRFSTRPDTVDEKRMEMLSGYPVSTIEIGAQSMDDRVLSLSKRGHSSRDTAEAVRLLKENSYDTGLQMMTGLPGEDGESSFATGKRVAELSPDFVRIYPTLVIRGSLLEEWYRTGRYAPLTLSGSLERVKALVLLFSERKIPIARIGLQANEGLDSGRDLVAGPYHPAMGQLVASEILFDKAASGISRFIETDPGGHVAGGIQLVVHPRMISTMRGQKNINIHRLEKRFPGVGPIEVKPDHDIRETKSRSGKGFLPFQKPVIRIHSGQ